MMASSLTYRLLFGIILLTLGSFASDKLFNGGCGGSTIDRGTNATLHQLGVCHLDSDADKFTVCSADLASCCKPEGDGEGKDCCCPAYFSTTYSCCRSKLIAAIVVPIVLVVLIILGIVLYCIFIKR